VELYLCSLYTTSLRVLAANHFHHPVVCLTTGPQAHPKQVPHRVRSSASFPNLQYPLFSLLPSSSYLRLLPSPPFTSFGKRIPRKSKCGRISICFPQRSTAGHTCCCTIMNHLEHHLPCASSRY